MNNDRRELPNPTRIPEQAGGSPPAQRDAHTLLAPSRLVAVSEREFIRGCLSYWLLARCPEFEVSAVTDLAEICQEDGVGPIAAIVIDTSTCHRNPDWIDRQIRTKQQCHESVPTILIVDKLDAALIRDLISRRAADSFIPTSDTTEVAAAALRLVIAGGHYTPSLPTNVMPPMEESVVSAHCEANAGGLTSRERAVLELLKTGKPNKIIAHKLGMSLSTAKIHVHNIIRKLNVQNRTEAVIAASKLGATSSSPFPHTTTKAGHRGLATGPRQDSVEITPHLANQFSTYAPRAAAE